MKEIEIKYKINKLPEDIYNYNNVEIEQYYLCSNPVLRIRREGEKYYFTYKGKGLIIREELNLEIDKKEFNELLKEFSEETKKRIVKNRYYIPYNGITIELDVFEENLKGLILAEVEFEKEEDIKNFILPDWFVEDVSNDPKYQNVNLINGEQYE